MRFGKVFTNTLPTLLIWFGFRILAKGSSQYGSESFCREAY
jgi:hypothetical protein